MAMLGKTVCYINSSRIALMRRVKTLKHKPKTIKKDWFINISFVKG